MAVMRNISRRRFLSMAGKGLGYSALTAAVTACGGGGGGGDPVAPAPNPNPPVGTPDPDPPVASRIPAPSTEYSVLKRTSFGVNKNALEEINNLGISDYLARQLDYENINASQIENAVANLFPLADSSPPELRPGFPDNIGEVVRDLVGATQYRAFFSPRQLYEVMVEFWTNHFSIQLINGFEPVLKPADDAMVIRPHALGNFRDLLHASAKSSAMLYYLDNFLNTAEAPNENYARELLELHTLGVDGGYTEQDIKEVARCFTGWTLDFTTAEFAFVPFLHDGGDKTVLGQLVPAGGGLSDGEAVLDLIAAHPSTARFIASKLCRRFISDQPSATVIDTVAQAFTASGGDIRATLAALFSSDEFLTAADSKLSRPLEFLGQVVRSLNPQLTLPGDNGELLFGVASVLGQIPFYWPTPDGYPDQASYWGSTGGLLNRWRIALGLSFGGFYPLTDLLGNESTTATVVGRLADEILMRPMAAEDLQLLVDWLADAVGLPPDAELPAAVVPELVPIVTSLLLSSVYFQLR
ncbi:MAG: DUF1800 domain-containing protein [Gammaproteobacteria bacterium]